MSIKYRKVHRSTVNSYLLIPCSLIKVRIRLPNRKMSVEWRRKCRYNVDKESLKCRYNVVEIRLEWRCNMLECRWSAVGMSLKCRWTDGMILLECCCNVVGFSLECPWLHCNVVVMLIKSCWMSVKYRYISKFQTLTRLHKIEWM